MRQLIPLDNDVNFSYIIALRVGVRVGMNAS